MLGGDECSSRKAGHEKEIFQPFTSPPEMATDGKRDHPGDPADRET